MFKCVVFHRAALLALWYIGTVTLTKVTPHCHPQYFFTRLDISISNKTIAAGFNFRWAPRQTLCHSPCCHIVQASMLIAFLFIHLFNFICHEGNITFSNNKLCLHILHFILSNRHIRYFKNGAGEGFRSLFKVYGVRFNIMVHGKVRKMHFSWWMHGILTHTDKYLYSFVYKTLWSYYLIIYYLITSHCVAAHCGLKCSYDSQIQLKINLWVFI